MDYGNTTRLHTVMDYPDNDDTLRLLNGLYKFSFADYKHRVWK